MNIGEMINKRRCELNLTLEEIGNIVGVSKGTVKKWESGSISNMKRDKIALLAKALQINPVSLITGDECIETKQSKSNNNSDIVLNSHEMKVILAYRKQPSMQEAVDRLLHIENEAPELIPSLIAARSVNNDEPIKAEKVQDFSKIKPTDKKL